MSSSPADNAGAETEERRQNPYPQGTPNYYLCEIRRAEEEFANGTSKAVDFKRRIEAWREAAEISGIDLAQHSLSSLKPIHRLLADPQLVNHNEENLNELKESMQEVEDLDAEQEALKKKWISLIDLTLEIQREAKTEPVKFSIYVLRCQETGSILHMSQIHLDWFDVWADEEKRNSLIEGPPSTGKTTCLYGQELWDLRENPNLRMLRQCGDKEMARKRLDLLRSYIQNARFKAISPGIEVDFRKRSNTDQFTLVRTNPSQDPTVFAAGCLSEYQGSGVERIDCDDLCPDKVQWEESLRWKIWARLHGMTLKRIRNWAVGRVRYIGNPWHPGDATSQLRRKILEGEMPNWRIHRSPRPHDVDGNPLPLMRNRPDWKQRRLQLIAQQRTTPQQYDCTERLDPRPEGTKKLKRVRYYDVSGGTDPLCPAKKREQYATLLKRIDASQRWHVIDPSAGGADLAGVTCFGLSPDGCAAIRSAASFRVDATSLAEHIKNIVMAEGGDQVLIEAQGAGKGQANLTATYLLTYLGPDFSDQIHFSGTRFGDARARPAGQNISKEQRYFRCLSYLDATLSGGVIMFPGKWVKSGVSQGVQLVSVDDVELKTLHDQLHDYPNVSQDQYIDCVSMFINYNLQHLVNSINVLRKERQEVQQRTLTPLQLLRQQMLERRMNRMKRKSAAVEERELLAAG